MDKLTYARETIGEIDKEIAALFEKRMNAVRLVSEYKIEHGLPIYDEARENALIEKSPQVRLLHDTYEKNKGYSHQRKKKSLCFVSVTGKRQGVDDRKRGLRKMLDTKNEQK